MSFIGTADWNDGLDFSGKTRYCLSSVQNCEDHSPSFSHSVTLEEKTFLPRRQGVLCWETKIKFYYILFQFYTTKSAISFQEDLMVVYKLITRTYDTIQDSTYPILINHHSLDHFFLVRLKERKTHLLLMKMTTNRKAAFRSHFRLHDACSVVWRAVKI